MDKKFLVSDGRWVERPEYIDYLEACARSWEEREGEGKTGQDMAALIRRRIEDLKKEKE